MIEEGNVKMCTVCKAHGDTAAQISLGDEHELEHILAGDVGDTGAEVAHGVAEAGDDGLKEAGEGL